MLTPRSLLYRVLDVAMIFAGAVLASRLCSTDTVLPTAHMFAETAMAFSAVICSALFGLAGVYRSPSQKSLYASVGTIGLIWLVSQTAVLAVLWGVHHTIFVPLTWFASWTALTGIALLASRAFAYAVGSRRRHARLNQRAVALVGTAEHCATLAARIAATPASNFHVVMTFDTNTTSANDHRSETIAALAQDIRSRNIPEVWLALPLTEQAQVAALVDEFRHDLINIRFVPDVRAFAMFSGDLVNLAGVPAINLVASPLSPVALARKDVFDRAFAAFALVMLSPLMLAIAVAVKLTSPGPALFSQRRRGADGKVFRILKFRSMSIHEQDSGKVDQATRNDPRITPIGKILRRTSLDELPQFVNVLLGDMSVVGPRPHAIEHDALYQTIVDDYIHRYRIKPGITGWAQINGFRGETDQIEKMKGRVTLDLYYLRNWSFALDMRIVMATITHGFKHSNAY